MGPEMSEASTRWLPDLSGISVLVVEDDEDGRKILVQVLQSAGATVTSFPDAPAALRELNQHLRPDIVICDLAMPRMDGLTFLHALREHPDPATRRTPMIAVTAYDEFYSPMQLFTLGCEAYMVKPLSLERLCRAIEKLAAQAAAGREESDAA